MGSSKLRLYYNLVKPGLIYGNILTVIGGYLYGAILHPHAVTLVGVVAGSGLTMACGTVLNNIQDRDMDRRMSRTKKRALVTGEISPKQAGIYSVILGSSGLGLLALSTNAITVFIGIVGLLTYAGVYTYLKPRTVHATLVGTIPGATPILAGYTAATNRVDASFWVLFAIMLFWQMTHFYAIATFRQKEYAAAKVPVVSVVYGSQTTKLLMTIFSSSYLLAIVALAFFGYAGLFYLAIMVPLALWWFVITSSGLVADNDTLWAKKVFFMSLLLLLAFCITLALNAWVP